MLKNKMKKILCGVTVCVTVCSQVIFPQAVFAATKKAVEKAGEEFVAAMEADAVKVNAKETNEQQGSGQESQGKAESENLKKAVEQINQKMSDSEAVFGIHEKTNRITIKIVDKKTKEVIREFPPEETLDMIAKAWELAGILVDEKR